jgi:hypothetical protein
MLMQHKGEKQRCFKGTLSDKPRIDLVIADMPEGLPVPSLSMPGTSIPKWNMANPTWLEAVFEFADGHLHDDGAIVIIHPRCAVAKATILKYASTYSFKKMKDWWDTNWLYLASLVSTGCTVCSFSRSFIF